MGCRAMRCSLDVAKLLTQGETFPDTNTEDADIPPDICDMHNPIKDTDRQKPYFLEELRTLTTEHHALFSPVEQNAKLANEQLPSHDVLKTQCQVCEDFISLFWEEVAELIAGCNMAAGSSSISGGPGRKCLFCLRKHPLWQLFSMSQFWGLVLS